MDKEKALEIVRKRYAPDGVDDTLRIALKTLIPELSESEDERIRKAIVLGIKRCADAGSIFGTVINNEGVNYHDVLTYLEKQKINTEGDFGRGYDCGYQAGYAVAKNEMKPKVATATLDSEKQKEQKPESITSDVKEYIIREDYTSAYYEERGYKNGYADGVRDTKAAIAKSPVEQKPVEWSEEEEKMLKDCCVAVTSSDYYFSYEERCAMEDWLKSLRPQPKVEWSEDDEELLDSIIKVVCGVGIQPNRLRDIQVRFLKSLRPQPRKEIYQAARHDLALRFMNYLDENRPEGKMGLSNAECEDIDKAFKENDWAKIMRYVEKYHPQSAEWSEEEEKVIEAACDLLCEYAGYYKEKDMEAKNLQLFKVSQTLKSLSMRCPKKSDNWKPSKEQMEALEIILRYGDKESTHIKNLTSLYNQLKKL